MRLHKKKSRANVWPNHYFYFHFGMENSQTENDFDLRQHTSDKLKYNTFEWSGWQHPVPFFGVKFTSITSAQFFRDPIYVLRLHQFSVAWAQATGAVLLRVFNKINMCAGRKAEAAATAVWVAIIKLQAEDDGAGNAANSMWLRVMMMNRCNHKPERN